MGKGYKDWRAAGYPVYEFGFSFWVGKRWGFRLNLGPLVVQGDSHAHYFKGGLRPTESTEHKRLCWGWRRRVELAKDESGEETWIHPSWIDNGTYQRA